MAGNDEYYIGSPDIKRTDNVYAYRIPEWSELLYVIFKHNIKRCDLIIIGAIYCNSDQIGGTTLHMENTQELYRVLQIADDEGDPAMTPIYVQRLLGLECEPRWIVGFVVREL